MGCNNDNSGNKKPVRIVVGAMKAGPSRDSCYSSLNFKHVVSHVAVQHNDQGFKFAQITLRHLLFTIVTTSRLFQKGELTRPIVLYPILLLLLAYKCYLKSYNKHFR